MFSFIAEMFSYDYLVRAVVVGVLMSLCAALLGVSLVLKRYSMIGDGLSHTAFGTMAVALSLNLAPMYVALPVVLIAAFILLRISENGKIKGDAAVAVISTSSLAIGIVSVSLNTGINVDVQQYLFGSIITVSKADMYLSIAVAAIVITLYVIFYNKIFAVTFDSQFHRAGGTKTNVYNLLIALLTALVIVVGMRVMGAMLISGLIIFPALSSMRIFKSFKKVVMFSAVFAVVCFLVGMIVSYAVAIPTGSCIIIINLIGLIICAVTGVIIKKTKK